MGPCEFIKTASPDSYEDFMVEKYWDKNRPMSIHFELTQKCNLKCVHCLFVQESGDELSAGEICTILLQLKDMGVFNLSLSGGEIFARNDIGDILDFLTKNTFLVTLYTNGTLLNPSLIDKIAALHPDSVDISVYGATADVHDAITGVPGSFQKTVNSIQGLLKAGIPVLFKGFLLKNNFPQRWDMIDLAKQLGAAYSFDFNLIPRENGDTGNLSMGLTLDQLKKIYREVDTAGLILQNNVIISDKESQLPTGGTVVCNPGRINGCIGSHGEVFPCPVLRIPMGNLREKSFAEIWSTDKVDSVRYMTLSDLKTCSVCPVLEQCNRCPGVAFMETGDYLGPAPSAVCNKYKGLSACQ